MSIAPAAGHRSCGLLDRERQGLPTQDLERAKPMTSLDSFKCRKTLKVGTKSYVYYSLPAAETNGLRGISKLPSSMKVLLENLLRHEDGRSVTKDDIKA